MLTRAEPAPSLPPPLAPKRAERCARLRHPPHSPPSKAPVAISSYAHAASADTEAASNLRRLGSAFPVTRAVPTAPLRTPASHYDTVRTERVESVKWTDELVPLPISTPNPDNPTRAGPLSLANARALVINPALSTDSTERLSERFQAAAFIDLVGGTQNSVHDARTGEILVAPPAFTSFLLSFPADNYPKIEAAFQLLFSKTAVAYRVVLPQLIAISEFMPCAFLVVGNRADWVRMQQLLHARKNVLR